MCRIAGLVDRSMSKEQRQALILDMLQYMQAGGPDGVGFCDDTKHACALGHRRLAILDLSASGHQPMADTSGTYQLTYNGEIYNFRSLRHELEELGYRFQSETDTEVILHAYAAWGIDSFSRLSGMFAFALIDHAKQCLWLVRDEWGIKPLYWAPLAANGIAFASSVRALALHPKLRHAQANWPIFFLAFGHLPEPITTYGTIQPLKPGTAKRFCLQTAESSDYGIRESRQDITPTIADRKTAVSELRTAVEAAVKKQMVSDAPLGVFLSGGLDSSILALCAQKHHRELSTSAVYFDEAAYSEWSFQQKIKECLPQARHQSHLIKEREFFDSFDQLFADLDQPSCDGINTWFIAKYAREAGLKAVLSGVGGDEFWGGYPSFKRMPQIRFLQRLPALVRSVLVQAGPSNWKRLKYLELDGLGGLYLSLRGLFAPLDIARALDCSETQVWEVLQQYCRTQQDAQPVNAFELTTRLESTWYMRNQLLRDSDAMSMAHGLEIRVPFLDDQIVALSHSISSAVKADGKLPKQLLVDAFMEELPREVWDRPKMGFTFPFDHWFRHSARSADFFNALPDQAYQSFLHGDLHWSQLYSLYLVNRMGVG